MAESPFQKGWWGIELPGSRACDGTYCYYEDATLPPLDESLFRGDFQWLTDLDESVEAVMAVHRPPDAYQQRMIRKLTALRESAAQANVTLPPEFIRFMENADWQMAIPSCTACEFDLSEKLIPSMAEEGAYTVLFLRDQQDVLLWYLYFAPDGKPSVVCSPIPFDDPNINEPANVVKAHMLTVALSFEAFLYRFWMENNIWFAREEGDGALTAAEQAYVDHYL